jgi:hypothetical protein
MADQGRAPEIRAEAFGGVVRPLYQERAMKCYVVTDSELKSISLANGLMVVFFSLASSCVGFAISIAKDVAMAGELTPGAKMVLSIVQPGAYYAAAIFAVCGVWAYFWRLGAIAMIRRESGDLEPSWIAGLFQRLRWKAIPPPV